MYNDGWHNLYIRDNTGKKFFNTDASPLSTMSEVRNLTRHLEAIKANHPTYAKIGIDAASAVLMLDGEPWQSMDDILDDDLLLSLLED